MKELPASVAPALPVVGWIPPSRLDGLHQMALDEWLLDRSLAHPGGRPVLRLYRWSRPTLSLGFHQRRIPPHWWDLVREGVIEMVRRPTGGRAVLHGHDLTYALVWPQAPADRVLAYAESCRWLQQAFADLGLPLDYGQAAPAPDRASCFAAATAADLVHEGGAKRIGSAQLRRGGTLLQHGSLLLDPPAALWRLVFGGEPPRLPPLPVSPERLQECLRNAAARGLPVAGGGSAPVELREERLTAAAWALVRGRLGRYRVGPLAPSPPGTTSPVETIERATWPSARPRG